MKKTTLGLTVIVLSAGLGWTGCGRNETPAPAEQVSPEPAASAPAAIDERERELALREKNVAARERAVERVETQRQPAAVPAVVAQSRSETAPPPATPRPVAEPEPEPQADVEPWPEPEAATRTVLVGLPASTTIAVQFEDGLSSDTNLVGDHFRAVVAQDVVRDGFVPIPAGSELRGSVASVVPSKKIGGQARLVLSFDRLFLPSGDAVNIAATWEIAGKSQKKRDAATIGGSAAGGAVLGRILSNKKGKGTAIGAIVGAAIGTAVASENASDPAIVDPGSTAEILLESPVEIAVAVDDDGPALAASR